MRKRFLDFLFAEDPAQLDLIANKGETEIDADFGDDFIGPFGTDQPKERKGRNQLEKPKDIVF